MKKDTAGIGGDDVNYDTGQFKIVMATINTAFDKDHVAATKKAYDDYIKTLDGGPDSYQFGAFSEVLFKMYGLKYTPEDQSEAGKPMPKQSRWKSDSANVKDGQALKDIVSAIRNNLIADDTKPMNFKLRSTTDSVVPSPIGNKHIHHVQAFEQGGVIMVTMWCPPPSE